MELKDLTHKWMESDDSFFKKIDECGGWPVNLKYVSFCHSDKRECIFGMESLRNEWWTTIYSADDYYMWKLSPEAKDKWEKSVRRKIGRSLL